MQCFNRRITRRAKGCGPVPLGASLVVVLCCIARYCWVWSATIPTIARLHTATHYICYTYGNDIRTSPYSYPGVFGTSIFDNMTVFIASEEDIHRIFNVNVSDHRMDDRCQTFDVSYESYCCAYSPGLMPASSGEYSSYNNVHSWEYKYKLIGDTYRTHNVIDLTHLFYGTPKSITQSVSFKHVRNNNSELTIEGSHKCRGDIPLDMYPEIHITVAVTHGGSLSNKRHLHWYL